MRPVVTKDYYSTEYNLIRLIALLWSCLDSAGLSITTPISVVAGTERGSKFKLPTKARRPSTTAALACKLAFYVVSADSRHSKLAGDQFLCNMISVSTLKLGLILGCTQLPCG